MENLQKVSENDIFQQMAQVNFVVLHGDENF